MTPRTPPRLADWLLRRVLPRGPRGDTMRGDLVEELRVHPGSRRAAARTYWRHAISLAVRYAWRRGPGGAERRTPMLLDSLRQDVRFAARAYAKTPAFTVVILATLALGIGASTAIFSMVNGIVLKPLPFPDPDRLVFVNELHNGSGSGMTVSWLDYLDWRARARSFDGLASSRTELLTLTGVDRPQRLETRRVTGNFLRVLGVAPVLGRDFADADDRPGSEPVVMLSDALWRTQFGGSPSAIGAFLTLDGRPHRVIGVLPSGFRYYRPYDLFVSMGPHADLVYARQRADHAGHLVVGRLKVGVDLQHAAAELHGIGVDLQREYPASNAGVLPAAEPLASRFVSDVRTTLVVLMGAVGCLLLIACVNVANLLVARGAARQHELAVRAALGGGRARLTAQLLVESALVSMAGGALGLPAASWLLHLLIAVAPKATPRLDEVHLDGRAMLFALAATTLCGLVFGAFPALQASGATGQSTVVRARRTGAATPSHRLRRSLIAIEVAVALVLLAGAGLTVRTLAALTRVDTGFRADHVLTLRLPLSGPRWPAERRRAFIEAARSGIAALPGVEAAGLVSRLPIDGSDWNTYFIAHDKPVPARTSLPAAAMTMPSPGYFDAIGTRVMRGRAFTIADTSESAPVALVNETLARRIWPGEDAIGKQIKWGFPEQPNSWREIVGIVADVKYEGVAEPTPLQIYMPITQETPRDFAVVIRTSGPPTAVRAAAERVIHAFDADIPVYSVRTLDDMLATSVARERMSMLVFAMFGLVALTLASVGLYGVVAHGVTERTHEIGVRLALGADRRNVLALVVGQGFSMALVGTVVGLAAAAGLSRTLQGLLFGVTPTDPATFAAVVAILLAVALVACSVPAWRATRLDPSVALRTE